MRLPKNLATLTDVAKQFKVTERLLKRLCKNGVLTEYSFRREFDPLIEPAQVRRILAEYPDIKQATLKIRKYNLSDKETQLLNIRRIKSVPHTMLKSGIYFLLDKGKVTYVGQSVNLIQRLGAWALSRAIDFNKIQYINVEKDNLNEIEEAFIRFFRPKHNNFHNYPYTNADRLLLSQYLAKRHIGEGL